MSASNSSTKKPQSKAKSPVKKDSATKESSSLEKVNAKLSAKAPAKDSAKKATKGTSASKVTSRTTKSAAAKASAKKSAAPKKEAKAQVDAVSQDDLLAALGAALEQEDLMGAGSAQQETDSAVSSKVTAKSKAVKGASKSSTKSTAKSSSNAKAQGSNSAADSTAVADTDLAYSSDSAELADFSEVYARDDAQDATVVASDSLAQGDALASDYEQSDNSDLASSAFDAEGADAAIAADDAAADVSSVSSAKSTKTRAKGKARAKSAKSKVEETKSADNVRSGDPLDALSDALSLEQEAIASIHDESLAAGSKTDGLSDDSSNKSGSGAAMADETMGATIDSDGPNDEESSIAGLDSAQSDKNLESRVQVKRGIGDLNHSGIGLGAAFGGLDNESLEGNMQSEAIEAVELVNGSTLDVTALVPELNKLSPKLLKAAKQEYLSGYVGAANDLLVYRKLEELGAKQYQDLDVDQIRHLITQTQNNLSPDVIEDMYEGFGTLLGRDELERRAADIAAKYNIKLTPEEQINILTADPRYLEAGLLDIYNLYIAGCIRQEFYLKSVVEQLDFEVPQYQKYYDTLTFYYYLLANKTKDEGDFALYEHLVKIRAHVQLFNLLHGSFTRESDFDNPFTEYDSPDVAGSDLQLMPTRYESAQELLRISPAAIHFVFIEPVLQLFLKDDGRFVQLGHILKSAENVFHRGLIKRIGSELNFDFDFVPTLMSYICGIKAAQVGNDAVIEASQKMMDPELCPLFFYEIFLNEYFIKRSGVNEYAKILEKFGDSIAKAIADNKFTDEMREWALHIYHQREIYARVGSILDPIVTAGFPGLSVLNADNDRVYIELMAFYSKYLINLMRKQSLDGQYDEQEGEGDGQLDGSDTQGEHAEQGHDSNNERAQAKAQAHARHYGDDYDDDPSPMPGDKRVDSIKDRINASTSEKGSEKLYEREQTTTKELNEQALAAAAADDQASGSASANGADEQAAHEEGDDEGYQLVGDNGFIPLIPGLSSYTAFLIGRAYTFGELIGEQNTDMGFFALKYADISGCYLATSYIANFYQALFDPMLSSSGELYLLYHLRAVLAYQRAEVGNNLPEARLDFYQNFDHIMSCGEDGTYFEAIAQLDDSLKSIFELNPTLTFNKEFEGIHAPECDAYGSILGNAIICLCNFLNDNPKLVERYSKSLLILMNLLETKMGQSYCPVGCFALYRFLTTDCGNKWAANQRTFIKFFKRDTLARLVFLQLFPNYGQAPSLGSLIDHNLPLADMAAMFLQVGMLTPRFREQGYNLLNSDLGSYFGDTTPATLPYLDELFKTSAALQNGNSISYLSNVNHALEHQDQAELYALVGARLSASKCYKDVVHYFIKHDLKQDREDLARHMFYMHRPYGYYEMYLTLKDQQGKEAEAHSYLFYAARMNVSEAMTDLEALEKAKLFKPLPFIIYIRYLEELAKTNLNALLTLLLLSRNGDILPSNQAQFLKYIESNHEFFSNSSLKRTLFETGFINPSVNEKNLAHLNSWANLFNREIDNLRYNSEDIDGNNARYHALLEFLDSVDLRYLTCDTVDTKVREITTKLYERLCDGKSDLERAILLNWTRSDVFPSFLRRLAATSKVMSIDVSDDHSGIDFVMRLYAHVLDSGFSGVNSTVCLSTLEHNHHILNDMEEINRVYDNLVQGGFTHVSLNNMMASALNAVRGKGRPNMRLYRNICRFMANQGNVVARRHMHLDFDYLMDNPYGIAFNLFVERAHRYDVQYGAPVFTKPLFEQKLLKDLVGALRSKQLRQFARSQNDSERPQAVDDESLNIEQDGIALTDSEAISEESTILSDGAATVADTTALAEKSDTMDEHNYSYAVLDAVKDEAIAYVDNLHDLIDGFLQLLKKNERPTEDYFSLFYGRFVEGLINPQQFSHICAEGLQEPISNVLDYEHAFFELDDNQKAVIFIKNFIDYAYYMKGQAWSLVPTVIYSRNPWQLGKKANGPSRSYASLLAKDMLCGRDGARERFIYYTQSHLFKYKLNESCFRVNDHLETARNFVQDVLQMDLHSDKFKDFAKSMAQEGFSEFLDLLHDEDNGYVNGRYNLILSDFERDPITGYIASDYDPCNRLKLSRDEAMRARDELKALASRLNELSALDVAQKESYFYTPDHIFAPQADVNATFGNDDLDLEQSDDPKVKKLYQNIKAEMGKAREDLISSCDSLAKFKSFVDESADEEKASDALIERINIERILGPDNIERLLYDNNQWINYTFYDRKGLTQQDLMDMVSNSCSILPYRLLMTLSSPEQAIVLDKSNKFLDLASLDKESLNSKLKSTLASDLNSSELWNISFDGADNRWNVSKEQLLMKVKRAHDIYKSEYSCFNNYTCVYSNASYKADSLKLALAKLALADPSYIGKYKFEVDGAINNPLSGSSLPENSGMLGSALRAGADSSLNSHAFANLGKLGQSSLGASDSFDGTAFDASSDSIDAESSLDSASSMGAAGAGAILSESTEGTDNQATVEEQALWNCILNGEEYQGQLIPGFNKADLEYLVTQANFSRELKTSLNSPSEDSSALEGMMGGLGASAANANAATAQEHSVVVADEGGASLGRASRTKGLVGSRADAKNLAKGAQQGTSDAASLSGNDSSLSGAFENAAYVDGAEAFGNVNSAVPADAKLSVGRDQDESNLFNRLKGFLDSRLNVGGTEDNPLEGMDSAMLASAFSSGQMDLSELMAQANAKKKNKVVGQVNSELDVPDSFARFIFKNVWCFDEEQEAQFTRPKMFYEDENPLHVFLFTLISIVKSNEEYGMHLIMEEPFLSALHKLGYFFGASDILDCSFVTMLNEAWSYRFDRSHVISEVASLISKNASEALEQPLTEDERIIFDDTPNEDFNEVTAKIAREAMMPDYTPKKYLIGVVINYADELTTKSGCYYKSLISAPCAQMQAHNYQVLLDDSFNHQAFYDLFNCREMMAHAPNLMKCWHELNLRGTDVCQIDPRRLEGNKENRYISKLLKVVEALDNNVLAQNIDVASIKDLMERYKCRLSDKVKLSQSRITSEQKALSEMRMTDCPYIGYENLAQARFHSSLDISADLRRFTYVMQIFGKDSVYANLQVNERTSLEGMTIKAIKMQNALRRMVDAGLTYIPPFVPEYIDFGFTISNRRPWSAYDIQMIALYYFLVRSNFSYFPHLTDSLQEYRGTAEIAPEERQMYSDYFVEHPYRPQDTPEHMLRRYSRAGMFRQAQEFKDSYIDGDDYEEPDEDMDDDDEEPEEVAYSYRPQSRRDSDYDDNDDDFDDEDEEYDGEYYDDDEYEELSEDDEIIDDDEEVLNGPGAQNGDSHYMTENNGHHTHQSRGYDTKSNYASYNDDEDDEYYDDDYDDDGEYVDAQIVDDSDDNSPAQASNSVKRGSSQHNANQAHQVESDTGAESDDEDDGNDLINEDTITNFANFLEQRGINPMDVDAIADELANSHLQTLRKAGFSDEQIIKLIKGEDGDKAQEQLLRGLFGHYASSAYNDDEDEDDEEDNKNSKPAKPHNKKGK